LQFNHRKPSLEVAPITVAQRTRQTATNRSMLCRHMHPEPQKGTL